MAGLFMWARPNQLALRATLTYVVFAGVWIFFSDEALAIVVHDIATLSWIGTAKGLAFVAVTGFLLYGAQHRHLVRWGEEVARRERAEAEMRAGEERFRQYVEHAPIGVVVADFAGRFVDANPAGLALLGLDADTLRRLRLADIFPPEDRQMAMRVYQKFLERGTVDGEYHLRRPDGSSAWLYFRGVRFADDRAMAFVQDVTSRKRTEEELRKLSQAVEQSSAGIVITDTAGRIEYVNPRFTKMTGYRPDEVLGKNPRLLKSGETSQDDYAGLWRTITSGGEWRGEFHNRKKDGELYWEQATISPIVDEKGRVGHFLAVKEDITDRRAAEQLLRESEDRFRALVESVPAGIFVHVGGRFAFANGQTARLFGAASPEALLGTSICDRFHDGTLRGAGQQICVIGPERGVPIAEEVCRRLDGSSFDAEVSAVPFSYGGADAALVSIRDVGERKRLEADLRQAQKLEAIGTLAGGVAHDFNNLLTVIQGSASILLTGDGNADEAHELGEEIVGAADRAVALTRQLLLFSRKQSMRPTNLDLNDVVTNLAKMLRRILGEDVAFQTECASQLPPILGDVGMIEQVIVNLAVNARDAMPAGGRLTVTTGYGEIGAAEVESNPEATAGPFVCLSVTDTGEGIAGDVLPHIFEPFFTTKSVGQGTGLGLATVYGIVKQHRGWISVVSQVGQGTSFRIHFPASAGPLVRSDSSCGGAVRLQCGSETILVVEDEDAVRRAVASILARCGYTVLQASSGVAALDLWRDHRERIQLLLTDVVMPEAVSGIDLAARLVAEKPDLRVIYTSGYSAGQTPDAPLVDGVNFLQKPYDAGKLAEVVRRRLD